jgi:hypothetical protein
MKYHYDEGAYLHVFQSETTAELSAIKDWCRQNLGRSHGWDSIWWMKSRTVLVMRNGSHIFHALLTWG